MKIRDVDIGEGQSLLTEDFDEVLYRQMTEHVFDVDKRVPASHAFGPSTADHGMPSYSRSTLISAQDARNWHTSSAKSPSFGVFGVSTGEVIEAGTVALDDSESPDQSGDVKAPAHCFVDYRGLAKPDIKLVRAVLLRHALSRREIPTVHQDEVTLI
ncbi:hypothetical protein [Agreia bicolorata]|uniref:Uncharacterized protein n=1 Tax=Agreia bicolorata TaxID=110935 RepID=A0ABR5CHQ3_9MICO|nr:hypothetical protein [Agreia bicolorata]KJC65198.1 hypothetical protein TZ00_06680 [Agreia bicolorata]